MVAFGMATEVKLSQVAAMAAVLKDPATASKNTKSATSAARG
jgi:hypothetical protein